MRSDYYRSSGDVRQRHRGTFVAYTTASGLKVYKVTDADGSGRDLRLQLTDQQGNTTTKKVNDTRLILERPNIGMINLTRQDIKYAIWMSADARQQTKKSLYFDLYSKHLIGNPQQGPSFGENKFKAAEQAYQPRFEPFDVVLSNIRERRSYSEAFSNKFALSVDRSGQIVLYYKHEIVGYVVENLPCLFDHCQYLLEQLEEFTNVTTIPTT